MLLVTSCKRNNNLYYIMRLILSSVFFIASVFQILRKVGETHCAIFELNTESTKKEL